MISSISSASYFDKNITINQENWAVTLIANGGIAGNHAQIVVEGIRDSTVFRKILHLNGPNSFVADHDKRVQGFYCYFGFGKLGKVSTIDIQPDKKINYNSKSETWLRSAFLVNILISDVISEEMNQVTKPFNFFGRKSIFSREIEVFEIVGLDEGIDDSYVLLDLYEKDPGLCMKLYEMKEKRDLAEKEIDKCRTLSFSFFADLVYYSPFRSWYELSLENKLKKIDDQFKKLQENMILHYDLHSLISWMSKVKMQPDSCFTWARDKLSLIDVKLQSNSLEFLISPTKMYLKKA